MNLRDLACGVVVLLVCPVARVWPDSAGIDAGPLLSVSLRNVQVTDGFWAQKLRINRQITIPHNLEMCRRTGVIDNFARAAGQKGGDRVGLINWDNFLYKTIEAASYSLMQHNDPQLERQLDEIVALIAAAQEPDGYLFTRKTTALARGRDPDEPPRWSDVRGGLELYTCGHMYEAAVAHSLATGKREFLDVAARNADLVNRFFGPGRNMAPPGHEQIELALVRLYEATGRDRYWRLAKFFIDQRGNAEGHKLYGAFHQDHAPFVEQAEAVGQAPRATYLYSGAADIARITGDTEYGRALDRLWDDVVAKKMYITGGIGSLHENEGFGPAYELPNRTAYTEICAAISFPMWAWRMFRLHRDGAYLDVMERTLYNNFLAGVSLSGDRYFYACPPESDGEYKFNLGWCPAGAPGPYDEPSATRKAWFPCACCPPNLARYMAQVPRFIYATGDESVYVNFFAESQATVEVASTVVEIKQKTRYPWDGHIRLTLGPQEPVRFALNVRVPGWARGQPVPGRLYRYVVSETPPFGLAVNQQREDLDLVKGFARIERLWKPGDMVELLLSMPICRVICDERLTANRGKVALERGPVVYCAEGKDNLGAALNLVLTDEVNLHAEHDEDLLGGVTVLRGRVRAVRRNDDPSAIQVRPQPFTAIPYYAWSNRGVDEMAVWLWQDQKQAIQRSLKQQIQRSH